MNSCLYTGWISHRRFRPRSHAFSYTLFMVYLDLDELDRVFQGRWLWSTRRWALARFHRENHLGDPGLPLDHCVRELVETETGYRPRGPIRLLTHLRYFGYCFNPISIYYCFNARDDRLQAVVAEVTNTPWGERRCYVLDMTSQSGKYSYRFAKAMHVSPFMPMNLTYAWRCNHPGIRLGVHMDVLAGDDKLFDATLKLRRQAIGGFQLAAVLLRFPWMTFKVIAAIHWQALRLWFKGIPIFNYPISNDDSTTGTAGKATESLQHE